MKPKIKWAIFMAVMMPVVTVSCATLDPRNVDMELKTTNPYATVTTYTQALHDLGLMSEIYGTPTLRVQCNPVGDNTGAAMTTGGEIPRDVTEMMKSALNSIGGNTIYIPYDPSFIQSQMVTGYGQFAYKVIPDVVLSGGITEFDRGLETRGRNTDANGGAEFKGLSDDFPTNDAEIRYSNAEKSGLARITLDFNLLDFQTLTGIPKMNITNSMEVRKVMGDRELGISLFGQSFGGKGTIKKVQGRHAAVRLLVQLSMIQMVGKHLMLPYWRLLGKDAKPDQVVLDQIESYYYTLTYPSIIANVQEWLYIYGYDLELTGQMDKKTQAALKQVCPDYNFEQPIIDFGTFQYIYLNIPISVKAKKRSENFSMI